MTAPSIPTQPLAMLTFAPMIDSELSRLILAHYAIPYREEPHIFGWASVLTLLHGGYGRIPLIYGGGRRLSGPRALVDHFDTLFPEDRALRPARQPLRTQVEAAWERYNGELATYTARVAYFHLLPARDIMLEPFSRGVPRSGAAVVRPAYGLLRRLLTMLLRLKPASAAAHSIPEAPLDISNRHRVIRVGRPLDAEKPGLLFMCLNGDIERQFEFLQQSWLRSPSFHGLSCEKDPVLGDGEAGVCSYTIPTRDGPVRLSPMPRFVTTKGGGYFFLPGKRLVEYLCAPL